MQHVPYKGSGPAVSDLIGGQVEPSFQTTIAVINHVKSGKLNMIAISGAIRSSAMPQVPTFAEAGLPGYEMTGWQGLVVPAGTSKAHIDKFSSEMALILAMQEIQEYLAKQGFEPFISSPDQFAALMKADMTIECYVTL